MMAHTTILSTQRPRVVIIGAGFGGLSAANTLAKSPADITLIDKHNYHLFQPLLYQVATAALSPAQIAQPIRAIVRKQKNCITELREVTGIDTTRKMVLSHENEIPYDFLIVATGATHDYFGQSSWIKIAPGLKSIEDATYIRHRILQAFEQAELSDDENMRRALLTFTIVGAGPTGVEMAGAIAEMARHTLKGEFRRIDPASARIILAEAGPRVLAAFPEKLSQEALKDLKKIGVEVKTGHAASSCESHQVIIGDEVIPCRTIIWAAGVKASPAAQWLNASTDKAGRAIVEPDYSLSTQPHVFVIGDTAKLTDAAGNIVPGLAPAAVQAGKYVANVIHNCITNKPSPPPFKYFDAGTMATIGRGKAIALIRGFAFGGFIAWWTWGIIHLMPLIGFRNRIIVGLDWLWSYCTSARGARLIAAYKKKPTNKSD
jgi:NADH dehydrogenase